MINVADRRGYRPLSTLALAAMLVATAGVAASAHAGVRWRSAPEPVVEKMTKAQLVETVEGFAVQARGLQASQRFVMTFDSPVTDETRRQLNEQGIKLLRYAGDQTWFATVNAAAADLKGITRVESLRSIRPIRLEWKLHPDLVAGVIQPWSIVDGGDKPEGVLENPRVAAYIMFHDDVNLDATGIPLVQKFGADVVSVIDVVNGLVIELPYDNLKALASDDAVMWLEPPLPKFEELNGENRTTTGANIAQSAPYGLTGAGVTVLVYDGGKIRTTHQDFQGRAQNIDTATTSDHATHVAGTIGGAGIANPQHKGMAPGVSIVSAGFEWAGGGNGFLYTDPGDMLNDYGNAIVNFGADISNNSIGNNTEPNGFSCAWQGDYGFTDTIIDSIARGAINGSPFRIVWAAGNERQGSRCDVEGFGDYYSSGPPANAKNHISVGALNALTESMTSFSSWGPSDDGRMRPDISAPGCQSGGDGGVTSAASGSDTGYSSKCGTSMASPTVCGLGALIMQDYRAQYPSAPDMRGSTLKTIFMHTCQDILNPGPDYQTGYGAVRVVPAIELVRSGNFFENEVSQGGAYGAIVIVGPGDPELKVTIAWDDPAGTPNVNPTLVNDLDLVVRSPSGVQHFPWTLDPASPSSNAVRTQRNFRDNNEQVLVQNPEPGAWLVEVRGFNVPTGPQPFSLAASPYLVNCSDAGFASLNRNRFNCSAVAGLRVVDCGLNTDDAVTDSVTVHLTSTSDPIGFSLLMTETDPASATFITTVQLSTNASSGELLVAGGDTVTLTYQDDDDGTGQPATSISTAEVDCIGPIISNVAASNIGPRSATISFNTDEAAAGTLRYGLSCNSLSNTVDGAGGTTSHGFNIAGLNDNTTYYFSVEGSDDVGNLAADNNGGSCYSFTTPETPDYFTELFASGDAFDLDNRTILLTPNGTFEGYDVCGDVISQLPTNPSTGTPITNLGDDTPSFQVSLTGGQTVKLYGTAYSTLWVNPNGNLTFLGSLGDYTESLSEHFSVPRVCMLWDDLDPRTVGQVSYQQFPDRLVVSYVGVPQYSTTGDSNTFQVEMYFDGRIRLSWLAVGASDGLIGISRGTELPPDFLESDLSSYGCGPYPPEAQGGSYSTALATPVSVVFSATDDGFPNPPASLQYTVMSLPAHGALTDPQSGPIQSVPYTLVGNGNEVSYEPGCRYQGYDSFTFVANDSGAAPSGGDSNEATISVEVGSPTPVYSYLVDDLNPNWLMDAGWDFGVPTGQGGLASGGLGSSDPTAGFTGSNVFGFNLRGNYGNNLPVRQLRSTAIDCSGLIGVEVDFARWLSVERQPFDHATFDVSNDGVTWITVWSNPDSTINDGSWTHHSFDISSVADGQSTVFLRWTLGVTDGLNAYCGWNLDDIVVRALVPLAPCPHDFTDDCEVNFADINAVLSDWGTYTFGDINGILSNWGMPCE